MKNQYLEMQKVVENSTISFLEKVLRILVIGNYEIEIILFKKYRGFAPCSTKSRYFKENSREFLEVIIIHDNGKENITLNYISKGE